MKSPRLLVSLAAALSAATFCFGQAGESASAKKDCCAKDAACCTTDNTKSRASKESCGDADKACCKEAAKCCMTKDDCCKNSGACPDHHATKVDAATKASTTSDASANMVVKAYLPIADALAMDDFEKARHAAANLARITKASGNSAVFQPTLGVVHAPDLAAARQAFKQLSAVVTPLAMNSTDYVVMTCPMAKADWVQTDAKVRNPYYGSSMLTCGSPKNATK